MTSTTVYIDDNGNATIPGAIPGTYVATIASNGTITLEPGVTLTNTQIARLARKRAMPTAEETRQRRQLVHSYVHQNLGAGLPDIIHLLTQSGYDVGQRTAANDLAAARQALDLPRPAKNRAS